MFHYGRSLCKGPYLPVAEATGVVCQVLDILSVVHEAGIVHRDPKPDDIFLVALRRAGYGH